MNKSDITERNKQLILAFQNNCFAEGLSIKRILVYMSYLPKLAAMLGMDFDKVTRIDVEGLVAKIERSEHKERTKYDHKVVVKRFYKWLLGDNEIYPPEVRWIKMKMRPNKTLPEELITPEEVKKLIETAEHIRDKAFVSMLSEGGFRIGEVLAMRLKHVAFEDSVVRVTVPGEGKTGVRKVLLVNSLPYLATWISNHPMKNDPEYPLWICTGSYNHNKLMSYNTARNILVNLADKAGVKKRVNPHSFRHSRATILAKKLTESQLKCYFGWIQASKMAGVYVHLSGRDSDNAILEMHGLRPADRENPEKQLAPKTCARCSHRNDATARVCCQCGFALDVQAAIEIEARSNLVASVMPQDMINRIVELVAERLQKQAANQPPVPVLPAQA